MALAKGYQGTLTMTIGSTAHIVTFAGAWSAESSRDINSGKPRITATSTGLAPKRLGSKSLKGSISGEIDDLTAVGDATPLAARRAIIDAHLAGTLADLDLRQTNGLSLVCPGAILSSVNIEVDSKDGGTIEVSFENGDQDYTFPETPTV